MLRSLSATTIRRALNWTLPTWTFIVLVILDNIISDLYEFTKHLIL
jgi:hypothetical protein